MPDTKERECHYCGLKFKKNIGVKYQIYCSKFCQKRMGKIKCSLKRKKESRERKRVCNACEKPFKYEGKQGNKKYCKACKKHIDSYIENGFSYSGAYKKIKRLKGVDVSGGISEHIHTLNKICIFG